jgi:hypothetical protein
LGSRPGRGGGVSQLTGPRPAARRGRWVEALRIDPATRLLGLRVNIWTSLAAFTGAATWLIVTRPKPGSAATEASPD